MLRGDGGKVKNPDLVPASECACQHEECSSYVAPSIRSVPLSPGCLFAVKDIVDDVNSERVAAFRDQWRRELTLLPLVFPVIRSSADFSIGIAILMRVPAVTPLDRDGNGPAAINIGEGSTGRPAVTNVFR